MKLLICLLFFKLLAHTVSLQAKIKIDKNCKPFTLTVKVNNVDTGRIRIMYSNCNDSTIPYTADFKNGVATFKGFINRASEALLLTDLSSPNFDMDGPTVIRLILEPKPMNLSYSVNSLGVYNVSIEGSNSQTKLEAWYKENSLDLRNRQSLNDKFRPDLSVKEKEQIKLKLDSANFNIYQKIKNYVFVNRDSYTSTYLLNYYYPRFPIDTLKKYYTLLSESAQQNEIGKNLLNNILTLSANDYNFISKYGSANSAKQLKSARNFLDFYLFDSKNKLFYLKDFKGKYTFVNFWASWCVPCIKNIPEFEKFKELYKDQKINFVSISIDKSQENWQNSLVLNKLTGINLIDPEGILKSFYKIQGIPFYVIIDPDGNLAHLNVSKPGSSQLNKIFEKYAANNFNKID